MVNGVRVPPTTKLVVPVLDPTVVVTALGVVMVGTAVLFVYWFIGLLVYWFKINTHSP